MRKILELTANVLGDTYAINVFEDRRTTLLRLVPPHNWEFVIDTLWDGGLLVPEDENGVRKMLFKDSPDQDAQVEEHLNTVLGTELGDF